MCVLCVQALAKLEVAFGKEAAQMLLWNATCYPMEGEACLRQADELIDKHNTKGMTAKQLLEEAEDEMDKCMEEAKKEHNKNNPPERP